MNEPQDDQTRPDPRPPPSDQPTNDARLGSVLEGALETAAPPADLALVPDIGNRNRFIGPYELLEEPREGGMGTVYKARDGLGRVVALKVLKDSLAGSEVARKRFLNEAKAIADLQHDNIIKVHEFGELDHRPYFTMDYIGQNLANRGRDRSLRPQQAARYVEVLARAIQFAHDKKLLHRDLKPANILVGEGDKLLVADFGLVKSTATDKDESLTREAFPLGTASYMPPEQITGEACPQSDVYALGAILYFLLVGRAPFVGADDFETLQQVRTLEPVPPHRFNPKLSQDLEAVCLKCLAKDPADRYDSAEALAEDLERYTKDEPTLARPLTRIERLWRLARRHPRETASVCAVFIVLLAGVLVSWAFYVSAERNSRKYFAQYQKTQLQRANDLAATGKLPDALALYARILRDYPTNEIASDSLVSLLTHRNIPLPLTPVMTNYGKVEATRFTPDGSEFLTFTSKGRLHRWDAEHGRSLLSVHLTNLSQPVFSVDARWLGGLTGDGVEVQVWDAANGSLRARLPQPVKVSAFTFLANGSAMLLVRADGVPIHWRGETDWASTHLLESRPLPGLTADTRNLVISEDGRWCAGSIKTDSALPNAEVSVWSVETGAITTHLKVGEAGHPDSIAFGASGDQLLIRGPGRDVQLWPWREKRDSSHFAHPQTLTSASLHTNGQLMTVCDDKKIRIWDVVNGTQTAEPFGCPLDKPCHALFDSAGERALVVSEIGNVMLWDIRPGAASSLPFGNGPNVSNIMHAAFSPDGQEIAMGSRQGPGSEARVWNLDRHQPVGPVLNHQETVYWVAFSRSGELLATACADGTAAVFAYAEGKRRRTLAAHDGWVNTVDFSGDGQYLLTAGDDGHAKIWDWASTNAPLDLASHSAKIIFAAFSPDSSRVVTTSDDNTAIVWNARTGLPLVSPFPHHGVVKHAVFSRDNRLLLTASVDKTVRIWEINGPRANVKTLPHDGKVNHAAFSPDGRFVITASSANSALLWDASTGEQIGQPLHHLDEVKAVVVSSDSHRLATVCADGAVRVWDRSTCLPITEPLRCDAPSLGAAFSPDAQRLLVISPTGLLRVWSIPRIGYRPANDWLHALAETVAGRALNGLESPRPVAADQFLTNRHSIVWTRPGSSLDAGVEWRRWFTTDRTVRTTNGASPIARQNETQR